MIRLLIADDEKLEREALAELVQRRFEREVVLEVAENGRKAADTAVLWGAVVVITCVVSFFVLASADWLERHMGEKLTLAFERLTGLLLAMMATQMFLGGVEAFLAKLPH